MSQVSMKAPDGASGFSVEGKQYEVVDGLVDVDNGHVESARSFGYTVAAGEAPVVTGGRPAMIQSIAAAARSVAESVSDDILIGFTSMSDEDRAKFWESMAKGLEEMPKSIAEKKQDEADDKAAADAEQKRLDAAKVQAAADAAAKKAADDKAAADAAADAAKKK